MVNHDVLMEHSLALLIQLKPSQLGTFHRRRLASSQLSAETSRSRWNTPTRERRVASCRRCGTRRGVQGVSACHCSSHTSPRCRTNLQRRRHGAAPCTPRPRPLVACDAPVDRPHLYECRLPSRSPTPFHNACARRHCKSHPVATSRLRGDRGTVRMGFRRSTS